MNIVILDAKTLGEDLSLECLERFGAVKVYALSSPDEIPERIREADIVLTNKCRLGAAQLAGAQRLKLIAEAATGFDNIDLAACRAQRIAVTNVKGYSTDCVAQLTAALALSLVMHLPQYTEYVRSGAYSASGLFNLLTPPFHELGGRTWGILGGGNIGTRVAGIAEALGCRVIVSQRHPHPRYETVSPLELAARSDIVSLHVPLNDGTRALVNETFLAQMKSGALLINVARGAVTDEAAVAQAVLSGKLGGFACDVYTTEPFPAGHPFDAIKGLPNVLLTPHMAWGSVETRQRLLAEIAENIRVFLDGGIRNRVDLT